MNLTRDKEVILQRNRKIPRVKYTLGYEMFLNSSKKSSRCFPVIDDQHFNTSLCSGERHTKSSLSAKNWDNEMLHPLQIFSKD